jgi:superfamily I DNA/RNA helicase
MAFKKLAKPAKVTGSVQQENIWEAVTDATSHTIVEARAGTGKTFTMIEALNRAPRNLSSCFVAFNKSIAEELATKVPQHSRACTLHSLGNAAIRSAGFKPKLNQYKTHNLIEKIYGRQLDRNIISSLAKVTSFAKNTMLENPTPETLKEVAFECGVDDRLGPDMMAGVPEILEDSKTTLHEIDFDDMIWLPVVNNLPLPQYDILAVDEAQDLNKVQQQLSLRAGKRILLVGDPYQSIYGFRGADSDSIANMENYLDATDLGVDAFPLTISRRCPHAAVNLVRSLVPDFEALPKAVQGSVETGSVGDLFDTIADGDMILSRVNAPLLSLAYRLLRRDIPCKVQGRDIGEGLRLLIAKIEPDASASIETLLSKAIDWEQNEQHRILAAFKYGVEAKLSVLQDRFDCIRSLSEGCSKVSDIIARIKTLFADVSVKDSKGLVLLSSIHKAKGLEADHVWVAEPSKVPHPMAKSKNDQDQERNLAYVLGTRFKLSITFLGDIPEIYNYNGGLHSA